MPSGVRTATRTFKTRGIRTIARVHTEVEADTSSKSHQHPAARFEEAEFPPPPEGPGFLSLYVGATLDNGRYELVRKLGWGAMSTVWLAKARASEAPSYVAIKVLIYSCSSTVRENRSFELQVFAAFGMLIKRGEDHPGQAHLLGLTATNIIDEQGAHLCFVSPPCAENVRQLRSRLTLQEFPLPAIKSVVYQTLAALAFLHNRVGVVHLDVKWDNVFINLPANSDEIIARLVQENPPQTYPQLPGQAVPTTVSQPLPFSAFGVPIRDLHVRLGDFGAVRPAKLTRADVMTPPLLRAPEILKNAEWSSPVDIWALGCMVYELLIPGSPLFLTKQTHDGGYRARDILDCIDVRLGLDQNPRNPQRPHVSGSPASDDPARAGYATDSDSADLETLMRSNADVRANVSEREIVAACSFMRKCLTVDPDRRPNAQELLEDEWFTT